MEDDEEIKKECSGCVFFESGRLCAKNMKNKVFVSSDFVCDEYVEYHELGENLYGHRNVVV